MNTGVIAMRYAKALLEYAKKQGKEESIFVEVKTLAERFSSMPELKRAIDNPVLSSEEKLGLLQQAISSGSVSEELNRFFSLVLKERREKYLQLMMCSYIDLYLDDKNIILGKLTTAVASDKLLEHFENLFSKQLSGQVKIESKVDEKLIGGYIIELAGYRMDASVANQLERVKQQFIERNRRIV